MKTSTHASADEVILPVKRKPGRPKKIAAPVLDGEAPDLAIVPDPPKKNGKATDVPADFSTLSTDGDLVDIWERRVLYPGRTITLPVRLKTPGMKIRWINLTNNGRYQRARYEEGWVPVSRDELVDEKEIYGATYTVEGWVCKGEKQGEMLMKMPLAVWNKIRRAKYDEVHKSNKRIKENMQSAGAKHFGDKYNNNRGDEIADTLNSFKGDIKFGSERVEPDEEEVAIVQESLE